MKKILAMLLAALMLLSLCACGASNVESAAEAPAEAEAAPDEAAEAEPEPEAEAEPLADLEELPELAQPESAAPTPKAATAEPATNVRRDIESFMDIFPSLSSCVFWRVLCWLQSLVSL